MPVRCPTCGRSFEMDRSPAPPFCSPRCRQVDLGRWLGEQNGIPLQPRGGSDDDEASEIAEGWEK